MANKERENFYKNSTLIVDHTKNSLIDLLELHLSRQGLSLEDFINKHQHEIYHLCFNTRRCCQCTPGYILPPHRVLYPSQLELLLDKFGAALPCHVPARRADFCCCLAKPGVTTHVLDITLTRTLLVNFCAEIFWYSCLNLQSITLEDFLNQHKHHLYHLMDCTPCCQCTSGYVFPVPRPILSVRQWSSMFNALSLPCSLHRVVPNSSICSVSATSGITTSTLGNDIVSVILEQCCSLRQTVEKLVQIRNKVYGHATVGKISDTDYKLYKHELENIILEISRVCGNENETRQCLIDLERRSLDTTLCIQYQNVLLEQILKEKHLEERFDDFKEKISDQVEKSVEKVLETRTNKQGTRLTEDQKRRLEKLKALTRMQIDTHLTEQTFVKTNLQSTALQRLEQNGVVILTGTGGIGKSRNSIALLYEYVNQHGKYSAISLPKISDWVEIVDYEDYVIVLLDDVFGRTNCTFNINEDTQYLDLIHSTIDKGHVKVIITMRNSIKSELGTVVEKSRLFNEFNFIDMSSKCFAMDIEERRKCLLNYCAKHKVFETKSWNDEEVCWKSVPETSESYYINQSQINNIVKMEPNPLIGFPEACYLFASNRKFTRQGSLFFKHPSQTLCAEIIDIQTAGETDDAIASEYALLVYILLNEDKYDPLNIRINNIQQIIDSVYGCSRMQVTIRHVKTATRQLTGRYLKSNQDGAICFQHRTIFESVLFSYKEVDPEKIIQYLDFEFILEMVCLENYAQEDAEVVFHLNKCNYNLLASRLVYLLKHNHYLSAESYMKKMCASRIIRYGDRCFFEELYKAFVSSRFEMYARMRLLEYVESEIEQFSNIAADYDPFEHTYVDFSFLRSLLQYSLSYNDNNESIRCILNLLNSDRGFHLCKTKYEKCFTKAIILASMDNNIERLTMVSKFVQFKQIKLDTSTFLGYASNNDQNMAKALKLLSTTVTDFQILDINVLMTKCIPEDNVPLVEYIFEEHGYQVFDLQNAFDIACIHGSINVARWLSLRFDCTFIDIKCGMIKACEYGQPEIIKFCLNAISLKISDLNLAMDTAIRHYRVAVVAILLSFCPETVNIPSITKMCLNSAAWMQKQKDDVFKLLQYMFKHYNHSLFDMKMVMDIVGRYGDEDEDIIEWLFNELDIKIFLAAWEKTKTFVVYKTRIKVLKLLFQHETHDHIDIQKLVDLEIDAQNIDGVKFLFEKCDGNVMVKMKTLEGIMTREDFILWIFDNIPFTNSEVEAIMKHAVEDRRWRLMKCLLLHFDHSLFDIHELLRDVCCTCDSYVLRWLMENFDHRMFDLKLIMERSMKCREFSFVRWLLENFDHSLFDVESMMRLACERRYISLILSFVQLTVDVQYNWTDIMNIALELENAELIKLCLMRRDKYSFDLMSILNTACRINAEDLVKFMLSHYDLKHFHLNMAFKAALKESKSPNITILKHLLRTLQSDCIDIRSAIEYACAKEYNDILIWLLQEHNPTISELKLILKSMCHHKKLEAIRWILRNHDFDSEDIMSFTNYVYLRGHFILTKWLQDEFDQPTLHLDASTINFASCSFMEITFFINNFESCRRDIESILIYLHRPKNTAFSYLSDCLYSEFVKCLIETYAHSLLNMKLIFKHLCMNGDVKMASWLLETFEHNLLDINMAVIEATKKNKISIVQLVYEFTMKKKIKFDPSTIFLNACIHGSASVIHWILNKFDNCIDISNTIQESLAEVDQFNLCLTVCSMENYYGCTSSRIRQEIINCNIISFNSVFQSGLSKDKMDFAKWLLNVVDIVDIDVQQATDEILRRFPPDMDLIKTLLSLSPGTKLPMVRIMNKACDSGRSDMTNWLYENFDLSVFNIKSAFIHACGSGKLKLIEWFFDTFESTSFHVPSAIRYAYSTRRVYDSCILEVLTSKLPKSFAVSQYNVEFACRIHSLSMLQWIVQTKNHNNINIDTAAHMLLLERRCYYNVDTMVKLLIQSFRPTNLTSITSCACKIGRTKLVLWILQNNENCMFNIEEIFVKACNQGDNQLVRYMLDRWDCKQFINNACLMDAFSAGNFAVVEMLVSNSDNMEFDTNIALMNACRCGSIRIVQWILNKYDTKLFDLTSAMTIACRQGNVALVQWLLQIFHSEMFDMVKAMTEACGSSCIELVEWFIDIYDIEMFDIEAAFLSACRNGRLHISQLLVSKFGRSAFNIDIAFNSACRGGNIELVKWLHEEFYNEIFDINSALAEACRHDNYDIVSWITQNFECENVQTPALQACEFGRIDIER